MDRSYRFIVDSMVGKLARWLRILGYDTLYFRIIENDRLLRTAQAEGRWIITRDARLVDRCRGEWYTLITDDAPMMQLRQIVHELHLDRDIHLLTRCLECNEGLVPVPKEEVRALVPDYVFRTQEHFSGCPRCRRIYWKGTHEARMKERLHALFPHIPVE